MDSPVITLTTDFGTSDPYVGVMKGIILGINPKARIVDISHQIQPQSIVEGAFIIGTSHGYFPDGTIHVVVVDPGVGTSRNALLLVTSAARYLVPDNGVLSYILREGITSETEALQGSKMALPRGYRAFRLTNPDYWHHPVSSTFHGRDVFAPVAAHLSLGVLPESLGDEVQEVVCLPHRMPQWVEDRLEGHVVHVDHFGNLITDIPAEILASNKHTTIDIKEHRISGLSPSYAEGGPLLAIIGSHGTLEISVKNSNAARKLSAVVGDIVRVEASL